MNPIALHLATRLFDSPLIQNQYRSLFVEAMLEPHLAPQGWRHIGDNWAGWDFEHDNGRRLEVRQSAAWQTWSTVRQASQTRATGGPGSFDIAPRTGTFDKTGAIWTKAPGRAAHVYVFAWHGGVGNAADHRLPAQWEFFILPTAALPPQKTIGLRPLRQLLEGRGEHSYVGPEACAVALQEYVR